jgi:hypothetical protein
MAAPPARSFDVTFEGFYVINANQATTNQQLKGIGVITADAAGTLSGVETFTLVNPSTNLSNSTLVCSGSIGPASTITANSDGTYAMSIGFITNSDASVGCVSSITNLVCARHVVRKALQNDLSAGQYDCVATAATSLTSVVTILAVSERAHFGAHLIDTQNGD